MPARKTHEVALTAALLTLVFLVYVATDLLVPVSAQWMVVVPLVALASTVGWVGFRELSAARRAAILLAFAAAVIGMRWIDLGKPGRKAFARALYSLRLGMTQAQADAIMGKFLQSSASPLPDPARGLRFYKYDNTSDWGEVLYESGRVARVDFSPD